MYNDRERIIHHQQLLSKESAAADLQLLRTKAPKHPRLDEFALSPGRNADAILFELLGVASREEIVKNRLASKMGTVAAPVKKAEPAKTVVKTAEPAKTVVKTTEQPKKKTVNSRGLSKMKRPF